MTINFNDAQGEAQGYDYWDGVGERPGRNLSELVGDLEGSYGFSIGPITLTWDVSGYGRFTGGASNLGLSGEYRIPASQVQEGIAALNGLQVDEAGNLGQIRGILQAGAFRGRATENLDNGTTVFGAGLGWNAYGGSAFGGLSLHEQYGVGLAGSLGYSIDEARVGTFGRAEVGYTLSFGIYVDGPDDPGELGVPDRIADLALNNPDGFEAAYVQAVQHGSPAAIAQAAMNLPGVYPDAIIRQLANGTTGQNFAGDGALLHKSAEVRGSPFPYGLIPQFP